jgi:hypothetical protein
LLITNLDWDAGTRPAIPTSQTAVLKLSDAGGAPLAERRIMILAPDAPGLRTVTLFRVGGGSAIQPAQRHILPIPRTADFSKELRAYGGGALRAGLIHAQVTRTLEQFPGVHQSRRRSRSTGKPEQCSNPEPSADETVTSRGA